MLVVLSLFFGYLFRSSIPYYTLFLLLGLIMWNMFTRGISMSMGSVLGRGGVIRDVYFPRVVLVLGGCLTASFMACFELITFIALAACYGVMPRIEWLAFPPIFALEFLVVFGISMILSGMNAIYRDVQYIWQVTVQAGFFVTPVFYSLSPLYSPFPADMTMILSLNPITQVLNMARGVLIDGAYPSAFAFVGLLISGLILATIGHITFQRYDKRLAEEV